MVLPQLGPRTEERDTFTRLLGHLLEGRREGVRYGITGLAGLVGCL
jgi:hypothetical protein